MSWVQGIWFAPAGLDASTVDTSKVVTHSIITLRQSQRQTIPTALAPLRQHQIRYLFTIRVGRTDG